MWKLYQPLRYVLLLASLLGEISASDGQEQPKKTTIIVYEIEIPTPEPSRVVRPHVETCTRSTYNNSCDLEVTQAYDARYPKKVTLSFPGFYDVYKNDIKPYLEALNRYLSTTNLEDTTRMHIDFENLDFNNSCIFDILRYFKGEYGLSQPSQHVKLVKLFGCMYLEHNPIEEAKGEVKGTTFQHLSEILDICKANPLATIHVDTITIPPGVKKPYGILRAPIW